MSDNDIIDNAPVGSLFNTVGPLLETDTSIVILNILIVGALTTRVIVTVLQRMYLIIILVLVSWYQQLKR